MGRTYRYTLRFAPLLFLAARALAGPPLRVCDDVQDPPSLNPYQVFTEKTHTLLQQMFEGLLRFDPEGKFEPSLALSWERVDPLTMRFHLRQGVAFHNGEPLDAKAVKFSLEKYVDAATHYPGYGFVETIARVDIIDDRTVDVVTKRPDGLLLNRMAAWLHIVPPAYYAKVGDQGFSDHPVGTGPFQFERWEKGQRIVFSRNPRYWMAGYPKVDGLVFEFLPQGRDVDALLAGKIDILTGLPGTRTLEIQESTSTFVIKKPALYTMAANFNIGRAPLSNKRVREAINLAVNRAELIRYDIFGNGFPIATLGLPGEPGTDTALKPYPFDPKRAKQILVEEGYGGGFSLKVLLKANADRAGRILAKQLSRVGIKTDVTWITDSQLFIFLKDPRRWDMAIYSCPDPMHHAYFIRSVFLAGDSPFALYPDPGVDERLKKLVTTLDTEGQEKASKELDDYIYDQFLALPTYQRLGVYGLRRGVGFTPYITGMPYFFSTTIHEN